MSTWIKLRQGALGNQLFQYSAIRCQARSGDRVLLIGMPELKELFDCIDGTCILRPSRPLSFGSRLLEKFMVRRDWQRTSKLVGALVETPNGARRIVATDSKFVFVEGYFQHGAPAASAGASSLQVRKSHVARAEALLEHWGVQKNEAYFVHVRASDFATWPSPEHAALLPTHWYLQAAGLLSNRTGKSTAIVLSESTEAARGVAYSLKSPYWAAGDWSRDFALMTALEAGVLSASTFSWWAARFAAWSAPDSTFIAPYHWAGHRTGQWFPQDMVSDFLTYLPVYE